MEKHIIPDRDRAVADLAADVVETLATQLDESTVVWQSSETSEPMIERNGRRFRLQFVEILP